MTIKRIVIGLILLAGIGTVVVMNMGPKEKVKIQVQTEKSRMEAITQVVTASGKIRPETEVKVAADVGGYIRKLTVEEGDQVKKDQLLVEVDQEIYKARVMEGRAVEQTARANLSLAEASQARAQGEARRVRGLHSKDLTSRANLEKAQADLAISQAEVEAARGRLLQARASLDKARKDLSKCTISAPIDGTVIVLNKEAGERASGGDFREDIILHVADLSSMEVEVEVGERDVVLISEDDDVDIEVDAYPGVTIPGQVKEIANAGVTRNQWTESEVTNFRVVIQVGQSDKVLRPQMSATVKIRTDHKDSALTVPIQSVTLRRPSELAEEDSEADKSAEEGPAAPGPEKEKDAAPAKPGEHEQKQNRSQHQPLEVVFVVSGGVARAVQVETGLSSDTRIEVTKGIEDGAQVVSGPYRALSKDLKHQDEVQLASEAGPGPDGRSGKGKRGKKGRPGRGKKH